MTVKLKATIFIMMMLVFSQGIWAAETDQAQEEADVLHMLGLFQGTDNGYELDALTNRSQGAVMLVRLLGQESNAFLMSQSIPFQDVHEWAKPHIRFLYNNKIMIGMSATEFGSDSALTANQYMTMLLRALGYDDQQGDFVWDQAVQKANLLGIIDYKDYDRFESDNQATLTRADMVHLSYQVVFAHRKDSGERLIDYLVQEGVVDYKSLEALDETTRSQENQDSEDKEQSDKGPSREPSKGETTAHNTDQVRAIWLSYLELQPILENKSEAQFSESIDKVMDNVKDLGLNTVFAQVRPMGDAFYPSKVFPWSYMMTGTEGKDPGYDPLSIMIDKAHERGIKIHAWINPYRIRSNVSRNPLAKGTVIESWYQEGTGEVIQLGNGLYLNPARQDVRDLIAEGVAEIIDNYAVDGIQFDDYFYPTTDMSFDADDYEVYQSNGNETQAQWRREQVNTLVRQVYTTVKEHDEDVLFGISPQGNMTNNYEKQYIDVDLWMSASGYVDYICPQIYYGYDNETSPYETLVRQWYANKRNEDVDLYIGLAAYKVGLEDKWAKGGINEWIESQRILMSMIQTINDVDSNIGYSFYRYDSLFNPSGDVRDRMSDEVKGLKLMMD